ncbi:HAD family hydrolase [Marinivivus vitaminiproducens]|uniref:HAD family hydrolase n=1 Tax=Marinivivus vitaminiproducens TaxID=3035935 RepID=UPI0027A01032|nr:HAD family phosphatase [Geminicoccaceae bacterium SCSIO 64248]
MVELVIFDCDGVLIDSEAIACRVEAALLTEIGFPIDQEGVVRRFAGRSGRDVAAEIEAEIGGALPAGHEDRIKRALDEAFAAELRPMPGIHGLLDRLDRKVCVASSSTPDKLRFTLGLTGLWERLAPDVFSSSMVVRGKPAPDLFLFAAERMGVRPGACVVVEDSVFGVQAAVGGRMAAVGFVGGSHVLPDHAEKLAAAGARRVIADLAELPRCIDDLAAGRL